MSNARKGDSKQRKEKKFEERKKEDDLDIVLPLIEKAKGKSKIKLRNDDLHPEKKNTSKASQQEGDTRKIHEEVSGATKSLAAKRTTPRIYHLAQPPQTSMRKQHAGPSVNGSTSPTMPRRSRRPYKHGIR